MPPRKHEDEDEPLPPVVRSSSPVAARVCGGVWVVLMALAAALAADTSRVLSVLSALCGAPLVAILPLWMLLRAGHDMKPLAVALNGLLLALGTVATALCASSALGMM